MNTKSTITDKRVTSVIERLEHFASNLKWTDVRGAQDLLTAADGLRELQERRKADSEPAPVVPEKCPAEIRDLISSHSDALFNDDDAQEIWNACRAAMLQTGNSPAIPDGYVMVPMRLTAENGAKGALSGEFSETKFVNCPECFGDDECETCDGSGRIGITVPVTWTTIKEIWAKGVEHFAAAPQEVKP
ncbi:hypothetical protein PGO67_18285 [Klebsiella aerogenes]